MNSLAGTEHFELKIRRILLANEQRILGHKTTSPLLGAQNEEKWEGGTRVHEAPSPTTPRSA